MSLFGSYNYMVELPVCLLYRWINWGSEKLICSASHKQYVVEPELELKSVQIQGHTPAFLKILFDPSQ